MLEGEARTFPVRVSRTDGACDSVQFLRHAATSLAGDKLRLGDESHPSRCVKAAAVKAVSGKCEMLSVGFFSARVTPTTPTRPPHGRGLTRLPPHQAHARQRIRHRASRALLTEGLSVILDMRMPQAQLSLSAQLRRGPTARCTIRPNAPNNTSVWLLFGKQPVHHMVGASVLARLARGASSDSASSSSITMQLLLVCPGCADLAVTSAAPGVLSAREAWMAA